MNTHQTDSTAAVDAFALAIMASCCQLSLIIDHMHRFAAEARNAPNADSVPETLRRVLRDVLTPLAEAHAVADLATAAQMLDAATHRIGDDLFFVDPSRFRRA